MSRAGYNGTRYRIRRLTGAGAPEDAFAALSRVSSITRTDKDARRASGGVLTIALFAFVVVVVLLAMIMGANTYGNLAAERFDAADLRAGSNLLLNSVRGADRADAVYAGQGPEGPSLVIVERLDSGEYETRLYSYQGEVLQEYAEAGSPYTPGRATKVADSATFGFSYENGLLTLWTDAGSTSVALRCAEGGAL